jgi:cbb3-type cytochrome oxidase subunit 3
MEGKVMSTKQLPSEINEHTAKFIVGVIAISLAIVEYILTDGKLHSVSESYLFEGDWPRNVFVGSLAAIGAFMLSYNGKQPYQTFQMVMSKVAALAAFGIALFPCLCNRSPYELTFPYLHGIFTALLFIILVLFCYFFFRRARGKEGMAAKVRAAVYALCGIAIVVSILILAVDQFLGKTISEMIPNLTFIFEYVGLSSFGIAWLTAGGHVLPEKAKTMLKGFGLI